MPAINLTLLDQQLHELGYTHVGGMSNRVYQKESREILKLGLVEEPHEIQGKVSAFQQCRAISQAHAPLGLMPAVYEVGDNFAGTGWPFLREEWIPGPNLNHAYIRQPKFWLQHLPQELIRIYRQIQTTPSYDVTPTWQNKLDGMLCPADHEDWFAQVRTTGHKLMQNSPVGWHIHGDLQFGNLLAPDAQAGTILLIDWEQSEVMPLSYEFAMLYTFLIDPDGQVEPPLKESYRQMTPLRQMWQRIARALVEQLHISPREIENAILFRMGNAWLYQLAKATENGDLSRRQELEDQLEKLLSRKYFQIMPVYE